MDGVWLWKDWIGFGRLEKSFVACCSASVERVGARLKEVVWAGRWVAKGLFEPVGWAPMGEAVGFEEAQGLFEPGWAIDC